MQQLYLHKKQSSCKHALSLYNHFSLLPVEYTFNLNKLSMQFSLCLEDIVPLVLGRYMKALILSVRQSENGTDAGGGAIEHLLEKIFSLFLEQVNLWSDICSLPEIKTPELTENCLYT